MKRVLLGLAVLFGAIAQAQAGWLIGTGDGLNSGSGTIKIVSSNYYDTGAFAVQVEGGQGACAGATWIVFPVPATNVESWKNSFEIAQTAFLTGHKVNIYNYDSSDCGNARFIQLVRP